MFLEYNKNSLLSKPEWKKDDNGVRTIWIKRVIKFIRKT